MPKAGSGVDYQADEIECEILTLQTTVPEGERADVLGEKFTAVSSKMSKCFGRNR